MTAITHRSDGVIPNGRSVDCIPPIAWQSALAWESQKPSTHWQWLIPAAVSIDLQHIWNRLLIISPLFYRYGRCHDGDAETAFPCLCISIHEWIAIDVSKYTSGRFV